MKGPPPHASLCTGICSSKLMSSWLLFGPLASVAAIYGQQIYGTFLWLGLNSQKKLASSFCQLSFSLIFICFRHLVHPTASIQFPDLSAFSQALLWGHLTLTVSHIGVQLSPLSKVVRVSPLQQPPWVPVRRAKKSCMPLISHTSSTQAKAKKGKIRTCI